MFLPSDDYSKFPLGCHLFPLVSTLSWQKMILINFFYFTLNFNVVCSMCTKHSDSVFMKYSLQKDPLSSITIQNCYQLLIKIPMYSLYPGDLELYESFLYFGYQAIIRYIVHKFLPPFCMFPYSFVSGSLCHAKTFQFDTVSVVYFCFQVPLPVEIYKKNYS